MFSILPKTPNIDFVGRNRQLFGLSTLLTVGSIVLVAVRGLNMGIDFAGGYELDTKFPRAVTEPELHQIIDPILPEARIQRAGDAEANEFLIMVRGLHDLAADLAPAMRTDLEQLAAITEWRPATGLDSLHVVFSSNVTDDAARAVFEKHGLAIKGIERSERSDGTTLRVTFVSAPDKIRAALIEGLKLAADQDPVRSVEYVGPQVGAELRNQGIMAVLWAMFFILLYIGYRFDLFFAPGAVVAVVHDVSVTLGVLSLFQLEFTLQSVAALLTIIGYSINDTIVVYDRVRENLVRLKGREFRALVNTSLNETLARTLLTGTSTFLVITVLWTYGVGGIKEFAIALFVGILAGTYSSLSVATPLYVWLHDRFSHRDVATSSAIAAGGAQR